MDYHRMNKVNIRIVRIFNTYGPRMHPYDGRVVSNFIRQALTGEDITILRRRQPDAVVLLPRRPDRWHHANDERPGTTSSGRLTWGTPEEFTILELAETGDRTNRLQLEAGASSRCWPTIRPDGSPISRWRKANWVGSRTRSFATDCGKRLNGSARSTCRNTGRRRRITETVKTAKFENRSSNLLLRVPTVTDFLSPVIAAFQPAVEGRIDPSGQQDPQADSRQIGVPVVPIGGAMERRLG